MSQTRHVGVVDEVQYTGAGPVWVTIRTGDGRTRAWRTDDDSTARRARARLTAGDRVTVWVKEAGPSERITAFGPPPDDSADGGAPA